MLKTQIFTLPKNTFFCFRVSAVKKSHVRQVGFPASSKLLGQSLIMPGHNISLFKIKGQRRQRISSCQIKSHRLT